MAGDVELEIGNRSVRISNPDRAYFPARGETKLDLVRYYISVGAVAGDGARALPALWPARRRTVRDRTGQRRVGGADVRPISPTTVRMRLPAGGFGAYATQMLMTKVLASGLLTWCESRCDVPA